MNSRYVVLKISGEAKYRQMALPLFIGTSHLCDLILCLDAKEQVQFVITGQGDVPEVWSLKESKNVSTSQLSEFGIEVAGVVARQLSWVGILLLRERKYSQSLPLALRTFLLADLKNALRYPLLAALLFLLIHSITGESYRLEAKALKSELTSLYPRPGSTARQKLEDFLKKLGSPVSVK